VAQFVRIWNVSLFPELVDVGTDRFDGQSVPKNNVWVGALSTCINYQLAANQFARVGVNLGDCKLLWRTQWQNLVSVVGERKLLDCPRATNCILTCGDPAKPFDEMSLTWKVIQ